MSGGIFFARHFARKARRIYDVSSVRKQYYCCLVGSEMCIRDRLENSIIDVIKEEQAKLGYRKEEIRLYYPLSSLDHFFETEADAEEMKKILAGFGAYTKEKLGNVLVSNKGDRFCFHIPEQGAEYVHAHMKPNEFIRELVELVGKHGCTMQQVKDLFLSKGKQVQMEPMDNGEFDLMIRFEGDGEDPYYYCFKDEGCHIIYHRFLPEDYADFGF